MADTRGLDPREFADHMRARRGAPPADSRAVLQRGSSHTGEGDWMLWIVVGDWHPWYGEEDGAYSELLDEGEVAEVGDWVADVGFAGATAGARPGGWMINVFVKGEERAAQLLGYLCEAAEAAVAARRSGTVTSSR